MRGVFMQLSDPDDDSDDVYHDMGDPVGRMM